MDFFEAQARARRRTVRLVVLFICAIAGLVAVGYFSTIAALREFVPPDGDGYTAGIGTDTTTVRSIRSWWDPRLLAGIAAGTCAVVGLASLFKWTQLRSGGRAVADMVGGRAIDPRTTDLKERQLLNIVEEMALASGVPVPGVYVLDKEPAINAFAAGHTPEDAVVAVTRGTLDRLSRDELQGVVAHEFSHILNGDMRFNLRLTTVIFGILVIGLIGRMVLLSMRHARVRSSSSGGGKNNNGAGLVAVIVIVGLLLTVLGYIGYFFGRLIQAAISRQREFLADASAVQFTRNPQGITGALKKIGGFAEGSRLQSGRSEQIGHFFFAQGFLSGLAGIWDTHPPLAERIQAIDTGSRPKQAEE
ncbi:MAG: M48 family metallopeptidase [Opitutaceae bacterium]|jgi:Zn-dependent protease with chaperone function|nr:M48 family metallopeptidase [Opitutaceae bacterium]